MPRALRAAGEDAGDAGDAGDAAAFCGLSFAPDTPVATPDHGGEPAISSLHVGDPVEAYDPSTGKTTTQHVQRVFVNHDTDLLDVTLHVSVPHAKPTQQPASTDSQQQQQGRTSAPDQQQQQQQRQSQHGQQSAAPDTSATQETETIHTTANHPWLTADQGWEQAGVLRVGEPVVTASGDAAVVVALRVVSGVADMWDLTVSNVHTFAVGAAEFVVHNCGGREQKTSHPDAGAAFSYVVKRLGFKSLDRFEGAFSSADDETGRFGVLQGERNGQHIGTGPGFRSWRLDYDAEKGPHFNWQTGKGATAVWGAAMFPGDEETVMNMGLRYAARGIRGMLEW